MNDPITNIVDRASFEDADAFLDAIDLLGLPEPKAEAFYYGNEADFLFLDRFGLAIRVGYKTSKDGADVNLPRSHDLVVEPWKQIHLDRSTIEICPIVDLGETRNELESDVAFLTDQLSRSGMHFWDFSKPDNIGYLPIFKDRFPQGLPIVIDRGAVMDTEEPGSVKGLAKQSFFNAAFYNDVQKLLFRDLKELLEKAWPNGVSLAEAKKDTNGQAFKDFCAACTANRNLPEDHPDKRLFGIKAIADYNLRNRSVEALTAAKGYAPKIANLRC